jgi:hypothetical protein
MIANILSPYSSQRALKDKIDYHISKIESGVGEYLYDSSYLNDITSLHNEMCDIALMNDRVKNPFFDISLSLVPGENLSNDTFISLANDYMKEMGYGNACYAIVRHNDREHQHVHILSTTIDFDGNHIDDKHTHYKSQMISRKLEEKYGLNVVEYDKFKNERLSKIKHREYYYSNALLKGLRSYNTKKELEQLLGDNLNIIQKNRLTNVDIEVLLGTTLYNKVGDILEKNNLFSKQFKEELLKNLDAIYLNSTSHPDFIYNVKSAGLYARLILDKQDNGKYTYGFADEGVYFKEDQLPQKYRYAVLNQWQEQKDLPLSEQKIILESRVLSAIANSKSVDELSKELSLSGIEMIVHSNTSGPYGYSFKLSGSENSFKASEINRKLSFSSINHYYNGEPSSLHDMIRKNEEKVVYDNMTPEEQKQAIKRSVQEALNSSSNEKELVYTLKSQGISAWVSYDDQGNPQGYSFRANGRCNEPFTARQIGVSVKNQLEDNKLKAMSYLGREEQVSLIKESVYGYLPEIKTLEELRMKLEKDNISMWIRRNSKDEILGFSFKMMNIKNAGPIRACEISKEFDIDIFNVLKQDGSVHFSTHFIDSNNSINMYYQDKDDSFFIPETGGGSRHDDDDLFKKKKNRRKNNRDFER